MVASNVGRGSLPYQTRVAATLLQSSWLTESRVKSSTDSHLFIQSEGRSPARSAPHLYDLAAKIACGSGEFATRSSPPRPRKN